MTIQTLKKNLMIIVYPIIKNNSDDRKIHYHWLDEFWQTQRVKKISKIKEIFCNIISKIKLNNLVIQAKIYRVSELLNIDYD